MNFEQKTKHLASLIKSAKKSARDAWNAGEILFFIKKNKEYKEIYRTFNQYTKNNFNVTDGTANQYIEVYKNIPADLITENMFVTHLYLITKMPTDRRIKLLHAMVDMSNDGELSDQSYDIDVVSVIKGLLERDRDQHLLSVEDVKKIWHEVRRWKQDIIAKREIAKKLPFTMGKRLLSPGLKEVENIVSNEPIDEQGLVALFCTILFLLKDKCFIYGKDKLSFKGLVYVRTPFPDARIEFQVHDSKQSITHLDIEFEYQSLNYLTHQHDKADVPCQMIICWEDNWADSGRYNRPVILSIKDLLETGNIDLI